METRGLFFGVVRIVMVRVGLEVMRLWVRSRRGIMWPCAGNGITSTCGRAASLQHRTVFMCGVVR